MTRQTRREFLKTAALTATTAMLSTQVLAKAKGDSDKPNFVIIFTDDQGYADLGCYGATDFETPNVDRMAAEGMKFTDFYVAASICSPSRAALLTGCYPPRVDITKVLFPDDNKGLCPNEQTIAEVLKAQGYATACIGKWHLGHWRPHLPTNHGFDYYFGIPYSNDMWPPQNPKHPKLPLIENTDPVELNPDQSQLTTRYTEKAIEFITKNKDKPFFVYLPHTMPHIPLFVSDKFKGKSKNGIYGDVIMEIDWSTGQILDTIKKLGLDEKTLVIFTSDNGPWLSKGKNGGSAKPLRDGKFSVYEGGLREPCIMRWPGKIAAGTVCSQVAATIDFLPTLAKLSGARLPKQPIDGKDISALLKDPKTKSPHEAFYYYREKKLGAVRSSKWKLFFGKKGEPAELYDLSYDIAEQNNVIADHPDIVKKLDKLAEKMRHDLGDSLKKIKGKNIRPACKVAPAKL